MQNYEKFKLTNSINTSSTSPNTPINNINRTGSSGTNAYASDAAWLAIRRHMQMNSFDDLLVDIISIAYFINEDVIC